MESTHPLTPTAREGEFLECVDSISSLPRFHSVRVESWQSILFLLMDCFVALASLRAPCNDDSTDLLVDCHENSLRSFSRNDGFVDSTILVFVVVLVEFLLDFGSELDLNVCELSKSGKSAQ